MAKKVTTEIFIQRAKKAHGDQFDYSKTKYVDARTKVLVKCKKCGYEFLVYPGNHLKYGCPKCAALNTTTSKEDFIKKAVEKWGDKYDYSLLPDKIYMKGNIEIICPVHGKIKITAASHLRGSTGCPECSKHKTKKGFKVEGITNRKQLREYSIWKGMKTRVTNTNIADAERYSKRGITCCDEWMNSFEKFYEDMGSCPEGYTLDRINNNKGYCKENCRWANYSTQAKNRGEFNDLITYNGETHVLKDWARIYNIKYTTLWQRIYRNKLPFERAISHDPFNKLYTFRGEENTLKYFCDKMNIKYQTVINRISKHKWTLEEALTIPYGCKRSKIQSNLT